MSVDGANPGRKLAVRSPPLLLALVLAVVLSWPWPSRADAGPAVTDESAGWVDALLEPFEDLSHWVASLFSHEERLVSDEIAQFKRRVDSDLGAFDALVHQAGFSVGSISVGASLLPEVSLALEFQRRISEPEKAVLMARITDSGNGIGTVERSVIMTLLNAAESGYVIRADGYRLREVDIDLDVVPNVTFVMAPGGP